MLEHLGATTAFLLRDTKALGPALLVAHSGFQRLRFSKWMYVEFVTKKHVLLFLYKASCIYLKKTEEQPSGYQTENVTCKVKKKKI